MTMYSVEEQTESSLIYEWLTASSRSLKEVWDNDEDAVYDGVELLHENGLH